MSVNENFTDTEVHQIKGLSNGPQWGFRLLENGVEWRDLPPKPTEWMHQLRGGRRADPERFHSGDDLVDKLHAAMHKVTGADCAAQ